MSKIYFPFYQKIRTVTPSPSSLKDQKGLISMRSDPWLQKHKLEKSQINFQNSSENRRQPSRFRIYFQFLISTPFGWLCETISTSLHI